MTAFAPTARAAYATPWAWLPLECDDAASDFFRTELENLVGRAADFKGADGLKGFRLEIDFLVGPVATEAGKRGFDERGANRD